MDRVLTPEIVKELREGLLETFRKNVRTEHGGCSSLQQTSGLAIAQSARALIELDKHAREHHLPLDLK